MTDKFISTKGVTHEKRLTGLILVAILTLSTLLSACAPANTSSLSQEPPVSKTQNELFDLLLEEIFIEAVSSDAYSLHKKLRYPENYGIDVSELTLSFGTFDYPTDEEVETGRDQLRRLESIDRTELTPDRQYDYDILKYELELFETRLEFYYYQDITGSDNIAAYMPLYLAEYDFNHEKDIENYLELCHSVGDYFDSLIRFQQEKSARGLFMSDHNANDVISACETVIQEKENNAILTGFSDRIENADFLSVDKKAEYINENKEIFDEVLVPAYERLIEALKNLKGTATNQGGLAGLERGREFYALLLKSYGIDKTPEELIEICNEKIPALYTAALTLLYTSDDINQYYLNSGSYTDAMTPEKMLDYLQDAAKADFPALPEGTKYQVKQYDDSTADLMVNTPALYFLPRLDDSSQTHTIYYHPLYEDIYDTLFRYMAHEGYPGHMLQNTHLVAGSFSNFRKINAYTAYSEGWTKYLENYTLKYTGASASLREFLCYNQDFDLYLQLRMDLGIHYEGWTLSQTIDFLSDYLDASTARSFYYLFIENPTAMVPYVCGYHELTQIKESFESKLGGDDSDLLFHETYLACGPAPFSIVKAYFDHTLEKIHKAA